MANMRRFVKSKAGAVDTLPIHTEKSLPRGSFEYLPVGVFASVMGLSGLSITWGQASRYYGAPEWVASCIALIAACAFVFVSTAYLTKAIQARCNVLAEFHHPVAGSLFGTIPISLLLLPILLAPYAPAAAKVIWMIGAIGMFGFAWVMLDRWMSSRQQVTHASPAWIIPVVGLLDIPLAVPTVAVAPPHGLMVACVAIGLFFAIPLFTMVFSRLIFEESLPDALKPTVLILVAPFAVGFSAHVAVTGRVDSIAESLYWLMVFMLAVLIGRLRYLVQCCPFHISWWAVSFPISASANAAVSFAISRPGTAADTIAIVLITFASIIIGGLTLRTAIGILRGELRTLSS